jgi:hypothetical protein
MFIKPPLERFLRTLEEVVVPHSELKKLVKFLMHSDNSNMVFDDYIVRRLKENIHPERLLNIAYHLEKNEVTQHLSERLNDRLAYRIVGDDKNYDQFYFMYRHDLRQERKVLPPLIRRMAGLRIEILSKMAGEIAPNIGTDKHSLILQTLEVGDHHRGLLHLMIADQLPTEDQYQVLLRALDKHSNVFFILLESSIKLRVFISEGLTRDGDRDSFATTIRNSVFPITSLETSFSFNNMIETHSDDIPATIARLYVRAEQEERWEYLLKLGVNKNKKELLRSIVKSKDHELINRFFSLYKNSPEVKHLTPFI